MDYRVKLGFSKYNLSILNFVLRTFYYLNRSFCRFVVKINIVKDRAERTYLFYNLINKYDTHGYTHLS